MHFMAKQQINGKKRWCMSGLMTGIMLVLCSGILALVCLYLQPGAFRQAITTFYQQPLLIVLNWFPALVLTLIAYWLTKNVFYGTAISGAILMLLSYVNLLKTEGREDPLVPADIGLIREAFQAVGDYQLHLHWDKIIVIVCLIAVPILLGHFVKSRFWRWPWRLAGIGVTALVFVGSVQFVYTNSTLYNSFKVPYAYDIPSVYSTLGFSYCFLHNYNLYPIDKPEGFSKSEVQDWMQSDLTQAQTPTVTPNVIVVMCEAFTDLADNDVFAYSEQDNPLAQFHAVADSPRAVTGHIVVSNYGAGTANTEFDVMTGMQTNMIGEGTTSAFRTVRSDTPSIASVLEVQGYNTFFMHPGQSWFYNRTSVYNHLGISDQIFEEAFDSSDYKGTMISDAAFLAELKTDLQSRLVESDAPLFAYTVTIQNHQSYTYSKYPFTPDRVPLNTTVSDKSMEALSVYMEGIRDSSAMLQQLTDYLDTIEEPTMVVFYGDHRPNLGDACNELGLQYNKNTTPQNTIDTYQTPYVIWSNQAYADAVDLQSAYRQLDLPKSGSISDNYLGAIILELAGQSGQDAFYDYLNTMRRQIPVVCGDSFCLADGTYTNDLTQDQSQLIEKLDKWAYYRLKYGH